MTHAYGYKRDKKDDRDFKFAAIQKIEQLPPFIDLRAYCSEVRDQQELGACTGFAMASGLREFMEIQRGKRMSKWQAWISGIRFTVLSPMFLYYQERAEEGLVDYDSGSEIRTGMKVLNKYGVAPEYDWRYNVWHFTIKPSKTAYKNAERFKIINYSRLVNLHDIKSALAQRQGVVFGFNVYSSFDNDNVANSGIMPVPEYGEELLGGHAVFCCGYKDDEKWAGGGFLICKNSWGKNWGDKGFFYMPYMFAQTEDVADIWTAMV